jgi:hypothetical protein
MTRGNRYIIGAALLAVVGCSGNEAGRGNDNDMIGTATFELAAAPADASCLRIIAAGSRTTTRLIGLMPGQATTFTLNGLPLGTVTFTESAFALGCGDVTDASIATWQSDPTPATLQAGVAANVTVVLRRNGTAHVTSDFQDDTPGTCLPPLQSCTVAGMVQCVDVTADATNCGACGSVCAPVANAASVCISSACTFNCNVSFRDCNGQPVDGCETNIFTNPLNCGACGAVCPTGSCQNGICAAAQLQVTPPSLAFPATPVGAVSAPIGLQLTNAGSTSVAITTIGIFGDNPSDFALLPGPFSVPPNATVTLSVQFQPTTSGPRQGTLSILTSGLPPMFNIPLTGQGL